MEMKDDNYLFADTNILIYATNTLSPWYDLATDVLEHARQNGINLVISPQIIREYLAAATRPNPAGEINSRDEILENVQVFQSQFIMVEDNLQSLDILFELVRTIPVSGKQIHDANIAATMRAHGIRNLLTHNTADFTRFGDWITILPLVG
ncbi:MAG: PIN domain-containing protein [Chloroflexi bacterium]|nr:PIN domain-containing protein [Chloroflexota bacterium]